MTTTRADDFSGHAVLLDWDAQFIPWMRGRLAVADVPSRGPVTLPEPWKPGSHWALNGITGEGKSTFAVGLLAQRRWVLALDPKGGDETLEASGYQRLASVPPPRDRLAWARAEPRPGTDDWIWHRVERRLPVGLIAGFEALDDSADTALHQLMRDAITWCRRTRGWTLYVDEYELLSSQRMFGLGADIERMLITARRAGTSVVTSFQAPAWVSQHAIRQARYITVWPTRNLAMVRKIADGMGRDWRFIAAALDELPPYHCLTVPQQQRRPMLVTSAPRLKLAA
jgi:hypothetical protein